ENVEHRFIDTVRRERTEAFEVRLVFKLERPAQHRDEVHLVTAFKIEERLECRRRIRRVERAVAIVIRWVDLRRTGRAAFGIGFAEDDGEMREARVFRDEFE